MQPRSWDTGLRGARHCACVVAAFLVMLVPRCVSAYNAQLGWSRVNGAAGYKVYVRRTGKPYGQGTDVGLKAPDPDGLVRFVVGNLDSNVTNYFAVSAYGTQGESSLSNELHLLVAPPAVGPLDAYLCDNAHMTRGSAAFLPRSVSLQDEFGSVGAMVFKPQALCAPVGDNGQPVIDLQTRQEAYKIKPLGPILTQTYIRMVDQFGTHVVNLVKADTLLVPTGFGLGVPPPTPSAAADHYRCYKVTVSPGTAKLPQGLQVAVVDQSTVRRYKIKKFSHLCAPVSENAQAINAASMHLMCYTAAPVRGQQSLGKIVGQIQTLNEFGAGRLDTAKEAELCVPAVRTP